MVRVFRLVCVLCAFVALPATLRADDVCLLCGGAAALSAPGSTIGGDSRPPIEIDLAAGFNFRRIALPGVGGDMLVEAGGYGLADSGSPTGYGLVGHVTIRGAPNAQLNVELPRAIVLTAKSGGRIEIGRIDHTLPKSPRLDANGRLQFSFSGALALPAGAAPGDYKASFSIDATYE